MMDFRQPWLVALIACLAHSVDAANVATSSRTMSAPATSVISFFSSTQGPWLRASTYTWSQYIVPTVVGTVMVTVDEARNQTSSTTILHSEVQRGGSLSIFTRTDTDAAGTVTNVVQDILGQRTTITYPTAYLDVDDQMTWYAVLPTTDSNGNKCCQTEKTHSPTPTHPLLAPVVQPTDTADPRGWLYTLVGFDEQLGNENISALWTGIPVSLPYDGCHFTTCESGVPISAAAASAVQSVANLLATTTITTSSASKTPDTDGVEVDPALMSLSKSPGSTPHATTEPDQQASPSSENTSRGQASGGNMPTSTPTTVNSNRALIFLTSSLTAGQSSEQTDAPTTRVSPAAKAPATIVVGSHTITQQSTSVFVVSSQALAPGSSITVGSGGSTTVVELRTSASHTMLVVGTSTSEMEQASPAAPSVPPTVTVGHTLAPGSAIGVSGTTVSLASGATELVVVVGSNTEVAEMTTSSSGGLGSLIWSGLGGAVATSTHSAPGSGLLASTAPVAGGNDNDNPTASQSDGSSSPTATPSLSSAGPRRAQSILQGEVLVVAISLVALIYL